MLVGYRGVLGMKPGGRKSTGNIPSHLRHLGREAVHLSVTSDQRAQVNEGFMKVAKHAFA